MKSVPILLGFILVVLVKTFLGSYEFIGLLVVGFIVGYMAKEGAFGGFINATVAGGLGGIIGAILFILFGAIFGVATFAIFGIVGVGAIFVYLIYYGIIMGITGAIGGYIAGGR